MGLLYVLSSNKRAEYLGMELEYTKKYLVELKH